MLQDYQSKDTNKVKQQLNVLQRKLELNNTKS